MKEIITQSMGYFDEKADKALVKVVKEYGYSSIFDLKARLDNRLIKFLKDRTNTSNKDIKTIYKSKGDGNASLRVNEVDTNRLWMIEDYDSAESIVYLEIEDEELNLFTISYK